MKNNSKKETMDNKDIIAEIEKRFERHTGVLIEKMDSTVKLATEQYSSVSEKLDDLKSDVEDLKNDMAIVKPVVERNSKDIKEAKAELHTVKLAVMDVSHRVDKAENTLSANIKRVENKLDENLDNHEKRLTKLEEKVFAA